MTDDEQPMRLSREDLYEVVWSKPMMELAKDFGRGAGEALSAAGDSGSRTWLLGAGGCESNAIPTEVAKKASRSGITIAH
jgi:hypothetical protein